MPEATMDIYRNLIARQKQVGLTRKARIVKSKTESVAMKETTDKKFGLCVFSTYARHHPASRGLAHDVGHCYAIAAKGSVSWADALAPLPQM